MIITQRGRAATLAAAIAIAVMGGALLAQRPAAAQTTGAFATVPVFNASGIAFAVYRPQGVQMLFWDPAMQNYEGQAALFYQDVYQKAFIWNA